MSSKHIAHVHMNRFLRSSPHYPFNMPLSMAHQLGTLEWWSRQHPFMLDIHMFPNHVVYIFRHVPYWHATIWNNVNHLVKMLLSTANFLELWNGNYINANAPSPITLPKLYHRLLSYLGNTSMDVILFWNILKHIFKMKIKTTQRSHFWDNHNF